MKTGSLTRNQIKGCIGEWLAFIYLSVRGYRLAPKKAQKLAQVDLVMQRGEVLVLIEVKLRRNAGGIERVISKAQKERLQRQARAFQAMFPAHTIRLDALLIGGIPPKIIHVKQAWGDN